MTNEEKLINLETKFSFQEASIEELKEAVHKQYLAIEHLEKSVNFLLTKLKEDVENSVEDAHVKPPHY